MTFQPAATTPCAQCPWRASNQGTCHPGGWYTKANLRRLWAGLRRGERMSCHPTDPGNPLPPGFRPPPAGVAVRECAGALALVQRELWRFQEQYAGVKEYRRARPFAMTPEGLWAAASALAFGGIPVLGAGSRPTAVDLNGPAFYEPLGEWVPPEGPVAP